MHIQTLATRETKEAWLAQSWHLLSESYSSVEGGLHFESSQMLLETTSEWQIIHVNGELAALAIFKAKHGNKISAFCYNREHGREGKKALIRLLTNCLRYSWVEVSEKAERFVLHECGGYQRQIANHQTRTLLAHDVICEDDGYHYRRRIQGQIKRKIMVGTPMAASVAA